ncbi:MAG: hypothetical protein QXL17_02780 [Candidatus Thermoplasmatota archaeon]
MKILEILEIIIEAPMSISQDDIDYFSKHLDERKRMYFSNAIEKLNKALAADEIINPEFQWLKRTLNDVLDETMKRTVAEPFFYAGKYESLPGDIKEHLWYIHPELHTIISLEKKLAKIKSKHDVVDTIKKFIVHAKPLAAAMAYLKTKVVKKVRDEVKREEKETKYREKIASHDDVKRIKELLTQITQKVYSDALEANKKWLHRVGENVLNKIKENPKESKMRLFVKDPIGYQIAVIILDSDMKAKSNYKELLDKEAKKITDDMMNNFIDKNTGKLSEIITKKNNMKSATVVSADSSRGTVEGTLSFEFKDGSSFTVNNKVVMSYSKYHKPFYRFPTTFHNVTFPDGSIMKQPSENKMIDEFAK